MPTLTLNVAKRKSLQRVVGGGFEAEIQRLQKCMLWICQKVQEPSDILCFEFLRLTYFGEVGSLGICKYTHS